MKQKIKTANKETEEPMHRLAQAVSLIKTPEEAMRFLRDLCTPAELQAMADRWLVVKPLQAELPYRQIYADTGVSMTTIGRVARCLLEGHGGYQTIYKRQERHDKKTEANHSHTEKRKVK